MQTERLKLVGNAKKNCLMCASRYRLRDTEKERAFVQDSVKQLTTYFAHEYDQMRRDNFPAASIQKANENRRICLDLLQTCQSCDKAVDKVNREISLKLK